MTSTTDNIQLIDSVQFCSDIEFHVIHKRMTYIDTIMHLCTKKNIEPEMAATLINSSIKEAIRSEALDLHMIAPMARLPF